MGVRKRVRQKIAAGAATPELAKAAKVPLDRSREDVPPEHASPLHHDVDYLAGHHDHLHPEPTSFWRKYIFSTDHKVIGIQFLIVSLLFFVIGGILAMLVRWQIAWPGAPFPFGEFMPQALALSGGTMTPDGYNVFFTMHASIMIFFVIIPLLVGAFGNYLIPLQIGARDMAFPFLNALAFWTAVPAGLLMIGAFFVEGNGASTGWTVYPPISADHSQTNAGQTLWLISIIVLGVSSMMGAINYITTIINMRAPGMSFFRMPLPVWALFITSLLVLFATPVLTSALLMLLLDRTIGTNFFAPFEGGQPLLFQHLFWFYSHPAVYIMILPGMGIASEVIAVFSRKPIFGYRAMVYAIAAIAGLGFVVWGHHMFQSGMNPYLGTTFMISTMAIAVPSAIKTFNWLGTMWGGTIRFTTPMLNGIAFVSMFVIGGLSGIFMASSSVDIYIHDTYFIVAHIHYVLFGGSVFAIFAGIYYWFPKMFGRQMDESLGKLHFWLTFIAYNCTFFPMHILGIGGMMRRIANPTLYDHLQHMQPLNVFVTISAFTLGVAQIPFVINFVGSLLGRRHPAGGFRVCLGIAVGALLGIWVGGAIETKALELMDVESLGVLATLIKVLAAVVLGGVFALLPGRIVLGVAGGLSLALWIGTNLDMILRGATPPAETAGFVLAPWIYTWLAGLVTLGLAAVFVGGFVAAPGPSTKLAIVLVGALATIPYAKLVDFSILWWRGDVIVSSAGTAEYAEGLTPILSSLTGTLGVPLYTGWGVLTLLVLFFGVAGWLMVKEIHLGLEAGDNPWEANTLEWQLSSPPWYANFKQIPRVHHGPYEYSVPGEEEDWLPQTSPKELPTLGH